MRRAAPLVLALVLAGVAWGAEHGAPPASRDAAQAAPGGPGATAAIGAQADASAAGPVVVHARAEPDTVTVGQRFRYVLEIAAAPETEIVVVQPTEHLGPFDIVDFGDAPAAERDGRRVVTRWFTLVGWSPGHQLVTSPPVRYRVPGADLADAPRDDIGVTIRSLLETAGPDPQLRDVKGPEPFPFDWRPYWLAGGALALLLALAVLGRWLLRRRRRRPAVAPPRPAHEVAAAALDELRRRRLPETGAFETYYVSLSAIVRTYLEQRFRLRAPEMTTEEFLQSTARGGGLDRRHRALLGEFMVESDLVKFARHVPSLGDAERAWDAARRFVDETAERLSEDGRAAG